MSAADRPRLLFLLPFPPSAEAPHGGARVAADLVGLLAERNPSALVYLRSSAEDPPLAETVRASLELVEEVPRPAFHPSPGLRWQERIRIAAGQLRGRPRWATEWHVPEYATRLAAVARSFRPDVVHVHYHIMGQYIDALADEQAPRVFVQYEPGAGRAADHYRTQPRPGLRRLADRLELSAWTRYERGILSEVGAAVVFTERDREWTSRIAGGTPVAVIPFGIRVPERPLDPLGSPGSVLFFGNFTHYPNVDAAVRLAERIWPRVRSEHPAATLTLVGPQPPPEVRALERDGVVVTGEVSDLTPYLDGASVVVAPLRLGGGMRLKILEALGAGKAVVASSRALEGLPASDNEVIRADTDDELAGAVSALLADPERRRVQAEAARTWALEHVTWARSIAAFDELHASLLAGRSGPASAADPGRRRPRP